MKLLSFAIPLYKRYDNLSVLLKQLTSFIESRDLSEIVKIIICDNTETKENFFLISDYITKDYIQYYANKKNVGMAYNFIECLKHADTKYCIMLGDDDEIYDEDQLFSVIDGLSGLAPDVGAILFDQKLDVECKIMSVLEFADSYYSLFGNFGYFCVKPDILQKYLNYEYTHTWPQTEITFLALLENNLKAKIIKEKIFDNPNHVKNSRISSGYFFMGCYYSLIQSTFKLRVSKPLFKTAIKNITKKHFLLDPKHRCLGFLMSMLVYYAWFDTPADTALTRKLVFDSIKTTKYTGFSFTYFFLILSFLPKGLYKKLSKYRPSADELIAGKKESVEFLGND